MIDGTDGFWKNDLFSANPLHDILPIVVRDVELIPIFHTPSLSQAGSSHGE